ncbi:MAG: hypothetical protein LBD07_00705 [Spirochaetaceae bacterium]|nr:hypothetical protein [Spirochaetaceae bacterium]
MAVITAFQSFAIARTPSREDGSQSVVFDITDSPCVVWGKIAAGLVESTGSQCECADSGVHFANRHNELAGRQRELANRRFGFANRRRTLANRQSELANRRRECANRRSGFVPVRGEIAPVCNGSA